jgi:hypothetical protein
VLEEKFTAAFDNANMSDPVACGSLENHSLTPDDVLAGLNCKRGAKYAT